MYLICVLYVVCDDVSVLTGLKVACKVSESTISFWTHKRYKRVLQYENWPNYSMSYARSKIGKSAKVFAHFHLVSIVVSLLFG